MDEAKRWRAEGQFGGDQIENRTSTQRINSRSSQKKEKKINQAADAVQLIIRMEVHVKQNIPTCRRHRETGKEK